MSKAHEVISAFLDDELFDPGALERALNDPEGRALLIDLVALRRIVQPPDVPSVSKPGAPVWQSRWRPAVAAAALVVALVGGYLVGVTRAPTMESEAPAPTRIVETTSTWEAMPQGVQR